MQKENKEKQFIVSLVKSWTGETKLWNKGETPLSTPPARPPAPFPSMIVSFFSHVKRPPSHPQCCWLPRWFSSYRRQLSSNGFYSSPNVLPPNIIIENRNLTYSPVTSVPTRKEKKLVNVGIEDRSLKFLVNERRGSEPFIFSVVVVVVCSTRYRED